MTHVIHFAINCVDIVTGMNASSDEVRVAFDQYLLHVLGLINKTTCGK